MQTKKIPNQQCFGIFLCSIGTTCLLQIVYYITLLFFWLNNVELAKKRVQKRVSEGDNIPVDVIERRYQRGIDNFFNLFITCVDKWILVDNSENLSKFVAEKNSDADLTIHNERLFEKIKLSQNGK